MKNVIFALSLIVLVGCLFFYMGGKALEGPSQVLPDIVAEVPKVNRTRRTLNQAIDEYGVSAQARLAGDFASAGMSYPPQKLALLAFKDSNLLEVWAKGDSNSDEGASGSGYVRISSYPILAASGKSGPKLREGDRQVPEGIYKVIGFNPNSRYHLSLKLNYPNSFDLKHANAEGRSQPGSNIFIHGDAVSIGCLAMGDPAIEEIFTLVHATGKANTSVLIAPTDPSSASLVPPASAPRWTKALYKDIDQFYRTINQNL